MDRLLLARRDLALDVGKLRIGGELLPERAPVEIGQDRDQEFGRLVRIDDVAGLGEKRRRLYVGRQRLAIAVDDVGPRLRRRADEVRSVAAIEIGGDAENDEPRRR